MNLIDPFGLEPTKDSMSSGKNSFLMNKENRKHRIYLGVIFCIVFPFVTRAEHACDQNRKYSMANVKQVYAIPNYTSMDVIVNLCDNNKYVIEVVHSSTDTDVIVKLILSKGIYRQKGDTLQFKDDILSYSITALCAKNRLHFLSGFQCLKSVILEKKPQNYSDPLFNNDTTIPDWKKQIGNAILKRTQYPWFYEKTLDFKIGDMYSLILNPDGLYKWYFQTHLISSGHWTLRGDLLICKDMELDFNFHCIIISPSEIQSMLMPGDYQGETLNLNPSIRH